MIEFLIANYERALLSDNSGATLHFPLSVSITRSKSRTFEAMPSSSFASHKVASCSSSLFFPQAILHTLHSMSNQVSTSSSTSSGGDKAGLVQRKVEQGINLAKQDAAAVASLGTEALKSTAYLYPV